jgi:Ser/Thr protein kinase RdoA (MazF antagonist)
VAGNANEANAYGNGSPRVSDHASAQASTSPGSRASQSRPSTDSCAHARPSCRCVLPLCAAAYARTMLDVEDAAEIAERFSLGHGAELSGPVARGEIGQVWRLSTSRGAFAVKEPFDPVPEEEVREHANYQEAAHAAGIPSPAVIRAGDGSALIDVGGTQVRVFEWVDLEERDPSVDPAEVGRLVASIHRLRFSGRLPTDPWYTEAVGSAGWDALLETLQAKGAPFASRLAEMRDELVALEEFVEGPQKLQTCHRDLWADNVLRTSTGRLCVIDWENCGLADPSQELANVSFEFGLGSAERARALYRAYLDGGGPGRIDRPGNFSMLIAQLGHIGENACQRWLDPNESESEHDRQLARVEEFTAIPLTRAAIGELIDAVTT